MNKRTNILIVGLGLIGGSYAKGLTKNGYHVFGLDISDKTIEYALKNQIIEKGFTSSKPEIYENIDMIIIGLYPDKIVDYIQNNQQYFKANTFISDVAGIKCSYIYEIKKILRKDLIYIPHHPMAGLQLSGIENSDEKIFEGMNFIITPDEFDTKENIDTLYDLANILKFKNINVLDVKTHDEMTTYLSQLTHVIAISLMTEKDSTHFIKYTGDSFRDLTRIATINENMWSKLFLENRQLLIPEIDLFINQIENIKQTLIDNDEEKLKQIMILSTQRRKKFDE